MAGCTLSAGQKLIPSSSPVPPTQGAGLARLAFCVRLSGGAKAREQESRGWSNHQCRSTDRRTDRCPVLGLTPPQASALRSGRTHSEKEGGPQCLQPPRGNGGDLSHTGSRAQGPRKELLAAQPVTKRSFPGLGCPTWLVEEGEGLNTNLLHHAPAHPPRSSLDGEGARERTFSELPPRTNRSAWALSCGMLTVALAGTWCWPHATEVEASSPGAWSRSNPDLPELRG